MLGAEGQMGALHPHTLVLDCPDTEAAHARSLLLDKHTLSLRKVEMNGGWGKQREREREGGEREGEERTEKTTQHKSLKTACQLVSQPKLRG